MKLHHATEGPWVPDAYVPPKSPTPIQVPKPYVLVMLRGFCTEFFETFDEMDAFAARCREKNRPYHLFAFVSERRRYESLIEEVVPLSWTKLDLNP